MIEIGEYGMKINDEWAYCTIPPENKYSVWIGLEDISEKEYHDINLKDYVDEIVSESTVDSKLIYKIDVIISKSKQIQDLGYYLDGDITMYGIGLDIIAPVRLMQQLGLV